MTRNGAIFAILKLQQAYMESIACPLSLLSNN